MGLEPEGVLGPKTRLSQGFLGPEKRPEYGPAKTRSDLALTALRQIENHCCEEEKREGNGEVPTPSAILRRIRVTGHRLSGSAWSRAKRNNQVVSTPLYFWTSSKTLPAPLTTQVRGSSST